MLDNLTFKANVARTIFGAANTFKHAHQVVWEYVSNELQYRDKKIKPKVYVSLSNEKITISGNGSGMNLDDLQNFFTMHAENKERKKGLPGRGLHGTGKTAAFNLANVFIIETVKNHKKYSIRLEKKKLNKYIESGEPIPLNPYVEKKGIKTSEPNGTTIIIEEIVKSAKIVKKDIIENMERELQYWKGAEVIVDGYTCVPKEINFKKEYIFNSEKEGFLNLGNINLSIKIAHQPLDNIDIGVAILANKTLHEMTLSGAEGKEMHNFIFGEIDCLILDRDDHEIAPFNMSREKFLNKNNPVVSELHAFIGLKVEEIRKNLVEENNKQKQTEEAKKREKQAEKIAEKLNKHFEDYKDKIKQPRMKYSDGKIGSSTALDSGSNSLNGSLTIGETLEAIMNQDNNIFENLDFLNKKEKEKKEDKKKIDKKKSNLNEENTENKIAKRVNGNGKNNSSSGSKFKVQFANHGEKGERAKFVEDQMTVFINIDHPYLKDISQKKSDVGEDFYQKFAFEIAFQEYAMALSRSLYAKKFYGDDTERYLQETREIMNKLSIL